GQTSDLLSLPEKELAEFMAPRQQGVTKQDRQRLQLAHALYQRLYQKYHTDMLDLDNYLNHAPAGIFPKLEKLKAALAQSEPRKKLVGILDYLQILKEIILSPTIYEVREDIYYKRHIAVDIPSMYGSYHEAKFDALGLTFRLEALVNTLFQELIDGIDLKLITRPTIVKVHDYLCLFHQALRLDGIKSREVERQLDLLTHALDIRGFSFTQYLDIFRGFSQVINNIVSDHFNKVHYNQLVRILAQTSVSQLLPKYLPAEGSINPEDLTHRVSEIFLRDRIATSLGLQQLDQFVSRIYNTFFHQDHELPRAALPQLLNYDPAKAVTPLEPAKPEISDIIHLGVKGFNLIKLISLGLPVPRGFIITTEVFRCREVIDSYTPARKQFRAMVIRQLTRLERQVGRKFGDPRNPLLLSVRSGSSISLPGMMNTSLNVGINEEIVEGMAAGGGNRKWFAWDCYRRYIQSYGMAHGLKRDDFDAIIDEFKQKFSLPYKREFSGDQMKKTTLAYKEFVSSHGLTIVQKNREQLFQAIKAVFDSWNSPRAQTYRNIMGISSDWGTAVIIQAMVFGNLSQEAGSGVFFTHNPRWAEDKLMLWGDFTPGNQGEDIVSGLVETLPLNQRQAEIENRPATLTLETQFPKIYKGLQEQAKNLIYTWGYSPQEIEFTFEGPATENLFFLQTRDMVLREQRETFGIDLSRIPSNHFLGRGIGVSGGGMSGRIVFNLEEIQKWRNEEPDTPLILIRGDTVPDDIREIYETDGLLTARGGSTSHAAIVAHQLKKTCIVGCDELICDENASTCSLGDGVLKSGEWISIDGLSGSIYKGKIIEDMKRKERSKN
ncbi:MAG: pyruvate, phosphate dikinase, partial [Deltaproteobacteria bacterium]|nr:pyruvate, phosphate dikinase [Deltaproteobacteria bacterium]